LVGQEIGITLEDENERRARWIDDEPRVKNRENRPEVLHILGNTARPLLRGVAEKGEVGGLDPVPGVLLGGQRRAFSLVLPSDRDPRSRDHHERQQRDSNYAGGHGASSSKEAEDNHGSFTPETVSGMSCRTGHEGQGQGRPAPCSRGTRS